MDSEDDIHVQFRSWAESQGITIHPHIQAQRLPGKGVGVVATQSIPRNVDILKLPASALVTVDSSFAKDRRIPSGLTVHCTLATAWTLNSVAGTARRFRAWESTWPSVADVRATVPLFWSEEICALLPPAAKGYLQGVRHKYALDWAAVEQVVRAAEVDEQTFKYYWMLVNSRCYYWNYAQSRKRKRDNDAPVSVDECMALCPFADYFNHGSSGCNFTSSKTGCKVTTDQDYEEDQEIILSYGSHDNDFLLVEYGFLLPNNAHDSIRLDGLLLPKLKNKTKAWLEKMNFLGEYTLYREDTCFRTKVALAAIIFSTKELQTYTESGDLVPQKQRQLAEQQIALLRELQVLISQHLDSLKQRKGESKTQLDTIWTRWKEMSVLVKETPAWTALDVV